MIKAYRHLYERMEISSLDGIEMGTAWVLKLSPGEKKPWYDYLIPSHRKFFDSLEPVEQLVCSLSCDPFKALKDLWVDRMTRSGKFAERMLK